MDFEANCGYFLKVQCFLHQISSYIIFDLQIFKLMLFYTVQKKLVLEQYPSLVKYKQLKFVLLFLILIPLPRKGMWLVLH